MDIALIKTYINSQVVFVPVHEIEAEGCRDIPEGEILNGAIDEISDDLKRSYTQLSLYFACCKLVADSVPEEDPYYYSWNTKEKVDRQCRLAMNHVKYELIYYDEKTQEMQIHREVKSISFKVLKHLEACGYFNDAFPFMGKRIGLTADELIAEAKSRMLSYRHKE